MGIIYIISVLILMISFILIKKSTEKMDIVGFICMSIVLLFCYNTAVCYVLTFFTIPAKLWILAIINLIFSLALGIPIIKKKEVQEYTFNKRDIIYIGIIIIVVLAVAYINFGFPFDINYISGDPAMHYLTSIRFAEQETLMPNSVPDQIYGTMLERKPASYVNSGLLMRCLLKDIEPVSCYYIFAGFDILTLTLIGVTVYSSLKKYSKKKEHDFWAFLIALICTLGYPLNSLLFGFEYLTMGLLILAAILDFIYYYEKDILKLHYILLIFGLLNFGLFCSYYMFVPFVYSALWIYFCIKNYYKTNKIITKELLIILIVTLLIPFILGYIYHLAPNVYAIIINKNLDTAKIWSYSSYIAGEGMAVDGFIYINLYSNMILLLPLPIYLFIKKAKNKQLRDEMFWELLLLLVILFIEILLIGNKFGKVSMYYLSKNYFALWIILAFINFKTLVNINEKSNYFPRLFIVAYVFLMIICIIFSKVKVIESTRNNDENILSVMDIFGANKTLLKYKLPEYNQEELEIIRKANERLDFNDRIEVISDHRTYYWSYVLLRYTDKDDIFNSKLYGGQTLLEKKHFNIKQKIEDKNELQYIIYFNKSKMYNSLKDKLFENAEIIYENPSGGILKYNNKKE